MISIIVAKDKNGVIGKAGGIPWKMPADVAFFKKMTTGHPIIMGKKTFESIGRPLSNRTNIILVGDPSWSFPGVVRANTLSTALVLADKRPGRDEIFVIGGGRVYAETIGLADRLYVTEIDTAIEGGDTFFPEIDLAIWSEVSKERHDADKNNQYGYSFVVYERRKKDGK